ncbi:MAG: alkene reductase, partial [Piscirickettsiaceae bacterium CG07_land_8_20_14_0_80_44_28]
VLDAVCEVWGSDRVGLRLSPLNSYNSMVDSDPVGLVQWLCQKLNDYDLAYLHVMRGDFFGIQKADVLTVAHQVYQGNLMGNMGYDAAEAETEIAKGTLTTVAFGVSYLANPDLPERLAAGAELNQPDPDTFYSGGAKGYTDYPFMSGE